MASSHPKLLHILSRLPLELIVLPRALVRRAQCTLQFPFAMALPTKEAAFVHVAVGVLKDARATTQPK